MLNTPAEVLNCNYFLNFYLSKNIFLVFSFLLLVLITFFVFKYYRGKTALFGLLLVYLGGLQNIYQRVRYNCIEDNYRFLNLFLFNKADLLITAGLLIILFSIYIYGKQNTAR